ncbi:MAG: hypothetical protein IJA92_05685, partial [Oscillospiraceae bacterium]|nr:hypothetical protein [Oscillospiraceae bacterium]
SARLPIYSRAGALLPPQTSNPKGSLPLEGKVSAEQTDEVFLQKPVIKKIQFPLGKGAFFGGRSQGVFKNRPA